MGYRLNRLDESIFMAGPNPMRTEFGIHLRLESCAASHKGLFLTTLPDEFARNLEF